MASGDENDALTVVQEHPEAGDAAQTAVDVQTNQLACSNTLQPGYRADVKAGASLHPAQLTARIKGAASERELMDVATKHSKDFDYIHAAAALSHAVKISFGQPQSGFSTPAVEQLLRLVQHHMPQMEGRQLANSLWAVAKLRVKVDIVLLHSFLNTMRSKLDGFDPQNFANTLWAMATLGHVDAAFTNALLQAAKPKLDSFKPQELVNTLWAMATLGHADVAFTNALLKAAELKLDMFNSQDFANTLWAMATLGHADVEFTNVLLKAAKPKLGTFTPQALANMLWAMATLGHAD
eukprot:263561-Chlamydomonas_euryale.AAC.1